MLLTRCERSQIFTKNILHVTVHLARPVRLCDSPTPCTGSHAHQKHSVGGKTRIKESEGGSADLRGLAADARTTANSAKAATEGKQARKEARAKKKSEAAEELSRRRGAYEACKAKCVCGKAPCPFAGLVLCTVCGDMKKAECRKQKCKAAKAAPAGPVAVVDRAPRSPGRKQGCGSHLVTLTSDYSSAR